MYPYQPEFDRVYVLILYFHILPIICMVDERDNIL